MRTQEGLSDALGRRHAPYPGTPRIVSLVPSLTELLFDLGLGGFLVGRTGFCVHPRESVRRVPKVGGTKDVALDKVRALAPTHLIVNVDENRRETVDQLASFVPHVIVTHPLAPHDNLELYRLLGGIFSREREALALQDRLRAALDELARVSADFTVEKVLYLIWRRPWMTVARATYISATLAQVGWHTLPAQAASRYPTCDLNEDWLGEIDRVLLPSEPYRFRERHLEEVAALPALRGRAVHLIDGEMTSWYGSRAIAGLRYLADYRRSLAAG